MKKATLLIAVFALLTNMSDIFSQSISTNPIIGDSGQTIIPTFIQYKAMELSELNQDFIICGKGQIIIPFPALSIQEIPQIMKIDACGKIDSTYGLNGCSEVNFLGPNPYITPIDFEINSDGSVIIAGQTLNKPILMKIKSNGFIDTAFANPYLEDFHNFDLDFAEGRYLRIDLMPDSSYKCLISFGSWLNNTNKIGVIKVNLQGELDTTFGNNGIYMLNFENEEPKRIQSILLNNDGSYFAAGIKYQNSTSNQVLEIIKLRENMVYDSSFNETGILIDTNFNITSDDILYGHSLKINHFNESLLISTINSFGNQEILRFSMMDLNGNIISNFGDGGTLEYTFNIPNGGTISVQNGDAEFLASYSNLDLDTSIIFKIDTLGNYSSTFNNASPLILEENNINVKSIISNDTDLILFGHNMTDAILKYLTYGNIIPNISMEGNYLNSNIDQNLPAQIQWFLNGEELFNENNTILSISSIGQYVVNIEGIEGCRILSDTIDVQMVHANQLNLNEIIIYPNPSNDLINVKFDQNIECIEVYDVYSRLIHKQMGSTNEICISTLNYNPGVYLIVLNNNYKKQFIVKR